MADPSSHLYVKGGIAQGLDDQMVRRASTARSRIADGAEPVLSLGHLAHLTGASYSYLRKVVQRRIDPYEDITHRKRDGGARAIAAPEPVLMDVQRWILRRILGAPTPHPASYAYQAGRSIVHCAERHVGARWLIKMDLHEFFPSVDERRIYSVFKSLGYRELVSLELTRVCTRATDARSQRAPHLPLYRTIPSYAVAGAGSLPQGAPTSGALANMVARPLDRKLSVVAERHGLIYTRYSDDLVFSSGSPFDRRDATRAISHIQNVITGQEFQVHKRKTRVIPPGARHIVLGLLLHPHGVGLLPEFKRRIDVHVRGVEKFGLPGHAAHRGFDSMLSFVNHVDGCIAFAKSVDDSFARQMHTRWNRALQVSGLPT